MSNSTIKTLDISSGHRRDIQGLRGIAVLMVVLYHAELFLHGGFIGVDVFFVLSGFVITRSLAKELNETNRVALGKFMLRRIRRLLPALALVFIVIIPLSVFFAPAGGIDRGLDTAAWAGLFNANTYLSLQSQSYFSTSLELNPFLHTWSLSVEEQFYLFFPTVILGTWILARKSRLQNKTVLAGALSVLAITSLMFSELLVRESIDTSLDTPIGVIEFGRLGAFYSAFSRAWEFLAGALVALLVSKPLMGDRARSIFVVAGLSGLAYSSVFFTDAIPFPGLAALLPVIATVSILIGWDTGWSSSLLSKSFLQYLGDVSYSWYLWHWPLIVFSNAWFENTAWDSPWLAAVVGLAALIPAELSRRIVENPIRFSKRVTPRGTISLGVGCVLIPLLLVSFGQASVSGGLSADSGRLETVSEFHLDVTLGCDRSVVTEPGRDERCRFRLEGSEGKALLIGDSNAGHVSEGLRAAALESGYELEIDTFSGCAFGDIKVEFQGNLRSACLDNHDRVINKAINGGFDTVFIGHAADILATNPDTVLIDQQGNRFTSAEEKVSLFGAEITEEVQVLTDAGLRVIVLQPVPRPLHWDPGACSLLRWAGSGPPCDLDIEFRDLTEQADLLKPVTTGLLTADAEIVSLINSLCPDQVCVSEIDGVFLYRDTEHLSVAGSEIVAPVFTRALQHQSIPSDLAYLGD